MPGSQSPPSSAASAGVLAAGSPPRVALVALGASAGGLMAFEQFFAALPAASGRSYVVVQHLDPTHKSMLVALLQRATALPVREATDGMLARADEVVVIPPGRELSFSQGAFRVSLPSLPRGVRMPIDTLFASLARELGRQATGIVLSGMGADGSLGLKAIRHAGGLTLAQSPDTATFDAMPLSAIRAAAAEVVCAAAEMPARIAALSGEALQQRAATGSTEPGEIEAIASVLTLLRERSGHDLSNYKTTTLKRRLERRMAVHRIDRVTEYVALVTHSPQELDLFFEEMLIGVTAFFRDPPVWQELKQTLPLLLERLGAQQGLRAWVAGCSTGEEAYTLAMLLQELADVPGASQRPPPQIFASDLNAAALLLARRGRYPAATVVAHVDPGRVERFFDRQGSELVVKPTLRSLVLFARHDLIKDPPFTRLDLLICRNLLIYFDVGLQSRLLPMFAYALKPGGALLLGSSETVRAAHTYFANTIAKSRLYKRTDVLANAGSVDFPPAAGRRARKTAKETTMPESPPSPLNLQHLVEKALLRDFAPPAVAVNGEGDVIYVNGSIGKFLEPAAGKANWNLHVMLKPEIRATVGMALRKVVKEGQAMVLSGLPLGPSPAPLLDISLQPLALTAGRSRKVLITFREQAPPAVRSWRRASSAVSGPEAAAELQRWKDEAQAVRLEMAATSEDLQAANEELQSTNEELQSTNEELMTSKEEGQSMNEELQTLNNELQSRLDDLALSQSDMQNLLNSTDIATLFLDNALNVRRYTEQITRFIHLREIDIGRPLSELASSLNYPSLQDDARETLRTLKFIEKEITSTEGLWFLVRIKPYRTVADVIQGVVITLIDITAAKQLEARLRQA